MAPLTSSFIGSIVDTFLFFSISFYGTGIPWVTLSFGDLVVKIFDQLRKKKWFVAPLTSSFIGSIVDTFLFFSISFYGTEIPWVTLSFGDLAVKILVALTMLIPFRLLLSTFKTA